MGRPAYGNRGISLKKGDYVIGAVATPSNEARNKARLERYEEIGGVPTYRVGQGDAGPGERGAHEGPARPRRRLRLAVDRDRGDRFQPATARPPALPEEART